MSSMPNDPEGSRTGQEGGLNRRDLLKRAGALGLLASAGGTLLAACGGDEAAAPAAEPAPPPAPPAAPPAETTAPATTAAPALEDEVNVIAWAQEFEFAVEPFQQETGVKVNFTFQTTEAESLQKVKASPETFDIASFGVNFPGYTELGLLRELDPAELANWTELPAYLQQNVETLLGGIYQVPYYWGSTQLARHTEVVPETVDSWDALWDPKYKGNVAFIDQPFESHTHIAFYTGLDPSDFSEANLATEREAALALIPNLKTFWSTGTDIQQLLARGEVGLTNVWDGTVRALIKNGRPVEAIFPTNGVRGWIDGPGIFADAPHPNAALAFLNYMTKPEVGAQLGTEYAYTPANLESYPLMDEQTKTLLQGDQIEEIFASGTFVVPVYTADSVKTLTDWWTDVKVAAGT
jgi:spermidine/putrescine transport system substrate-binding protein